ncbi:MAG: C39 family peptidase [Candidatus Omnitrophica bacterium]|nr:C39 family peptidase [Candidatus Omnitrophota bacterium]
METKLYFDILPQPDDFTCGPTCLHAVYNYYGDQMALPDLIRQVPQLKEGGTLGVLLACHALRRGYKALIYTYNMRVFDPTWFESKSISLRKKLQARLDHIQKNKLRFATKSYLQFVELGGEIRFEDLTGRLIQKYLKRDIPILTGLSATYLYRTPRERAVNARMEYDDVGGDPSGHFVVLCGYDRESRRMLVADPLYPNPINKKQYYEVSQNRLIASILLGVLTYDANLIILTPPPFK